MSHNPPPGPAARASVFERCLQEAADAAKPALAHCMDHAVAGLQLAETQSMKVAERDELGLAWRELLKHKDDWCGRYPVDLLKAFKSARPSLPDPRVSRQPAPRSSDTDLFSLVDNAQVEEGIESSRLLQQILPAVSQALAELDALMSSAQGLANVSPEFNPVRPQVYAQTLREMMATATADPAVHTLWVKHMAEPMGRELKRVYEKLVNLLEMAQVRAASYRVLPTPVAVRASSPAPLSGMGTPKAGGAPTSPVGFGYVSDEPVARVPSQYADLSNHDVKDALFQDFLVRGGSQAGHGLAPSYYATIEEELRALKATPDSAPAPLQARAQPQRASDEGHDYRGTRSDPTRPLLPAGEADADEDENGEFDTPESASRIIDVLSQLSSQVWGVYGRARERALVRTQLKKQATHVGQVLGMEVVRKLVNQVAQDPRLLVPVREAIVALEPSLLRLAMVDSRFFSEENHPGRRLMERVAQRSFKYNNEGSPGFQAFFSSVTEAFNALNALEISDARPFGDALGELQNIWDAQDREEKAQRSNMRQTMQLAEERQSQADQIAYDMSMRADLDHVPGVVLDFLFGPWALVMAHARLTDTRRQIDPGGYGSLVSDLLWSVKPQVTLKRPAQLIEMIPRMLAKLHEGLASLGQDPRETEAFFSTMEKLHRPVLKLRRVRSRRDAVESEAAPLEVALADAPDMVELLPATPEQRKAKAAGQPWMAPQELDDAGFEETLPSGPAELGDDSDPEISVLPVMDEAQEEGPGPETDPASAGQLLAGLREGSWVDLHSKRRWLRAQLIWASTRGTLFMFVSHGGQPHSMTKRSCEKLIRQGLLRPVQTHGVVAQALDQLVREATPVEAGDSSS